MNKKLIATKAERERMDEVDRRQQDSIEELSELVNHLTWSIIVLSIIWLSSLAFMVFKI